jgi:DNA-directed RNA polymerase II subunit RPB1
MLETDGVCLQKIMSHPMIDGTRTISNDIIEVKNILGVEAAR